MKLLDLRCKIFTVKDLSKSGRSIKVFKFKTDLYRSRAFTLQVVLTTVLDKELLQVMPVILIVGYF